MIVDDALLEQVDRFPRRVHVYQVHEVHFDQEVQSFAEICEANRGHFVPIDHRKMPCVVFSAVCD